MDTARLVRRSLVTIAAVGVTALGCGLTDDSPTTGGESQTAAFDGTEAGAWVDEVLFLIEDDAVSPPVASRILSYTGLGIYEATVDGMDDYGSLGERLHGLQPPGQMDPDADYDPVTAMNTTLGHLAPVLFEDDESVAHLIDFAEQRLQQRLDEIDTAVWLDSTHRGEQIADTIQDRALSDGYHARVHGDFSPPSTIGAWTPVGDQEPLEPHWATLEPFAMDHSAGCKPSPPLRFSTDPNSSFYQQARTTYDATPQPGSEEEEIAQFWADNPGESPTPPGHWMALANQMVEDKQLNLEDAARLYAILGVTVADAFISCWDEKYRSYLIRPVTYINDHIDSEWETTIATPPFPEYTSGHATVSGAAAEVLTELIGEVSFEDRTHQHRGLSPRSFDNFQAAAEESGMSRIYGGIHYPMANNEGLEQGRCVAGQVLNAVGAR